MSSIFKGVSLDGTVFETGMVCLSTVFVPGLFPMASAASDGSNVPERAWSG